MTHQTYAVISRLFACVVWLWYICYVSELKLYRLCFRWMFDTWSIVRANWTLHNPIEYESIENNIDFLHFRLFAAASFLGHFSSWQAIDLMRVIECLSCVLEISCAKSCAGSQYWYFSLWFTYGLPIQCISLVRYLYCMCMNVISSIWDNSTWLVFMWKPPCM